LAYILAAHPNRRVRNGKEATDLSRRACALDGYKTALYRHTLAAAEAEAGDFEAATRLSEEALGDDVGPQTARFRDQLALSRQGLPYRDLGLPQFGFFHETSGIRTEKRKIQNAQAQIRTPVGRVPSRANPADEHRIFLTQTFHRMRSIGIPSPLRGRRLAGRSPYQEHRHATVFVEDPI